ncbi:MAG: hypothetical protein K2Y37_24200 [Pirellulales bacterium]|nr:hypothetical protein [Pirellulales bacterium]
MAKANQAGAAGSGLPTSWLDDSNEPVIEQYARRLDSFLAAMADGQIDEHEVEAQEARLVKLMQKVEPQLSPELHAQVTQLLCELTAYDLMQCLYVLSEARPKSQFRG